MPIEFIVSIGSVNAIAAAHPAVVATAKQVGLEQVRDEAGEAAVRGVDNRQTSRRRQALNAQPRLTPASPEYLKYLADQQAMQQAVDRQMGGVGRSR